MSTETTPIPMRLRCPECSELHVAYDAEVAKLRAERARLVEEADDAEMRASTIADEAFGPFPVSKINDSLTAIEQGIFDLRRRLGTAEQRLEVARGLLREFVSDTRETVCPYIATGQNGGKPCSACRARAFLAASPETPAANLVTTVTGPTCGKCGSLLIPQPVGNVTELRCVNCGGSPETPADERIYPCADCGKPRSKAEGGTVFTVCDECWEKLKRGIERRIRALATDTLATVQAMKEGTR